MWDAQAEPGTTLGPKGRFRLERRLGEGSTGVVFAAWDEERQSHVALKTLRHMDANGIYHLKREFRSLADVAHPNLARLYELFGAADQDRWFLSMELINGIDFVSYVRADKTWQRLRQAFFALVQGMEALHSAGKLHRDIKPSNALVTPEGRVVLLDFGLVTDIALTQLFATLEPRLVGTPAYLSPEQAAGQTLQPSTDFYAAGAMLFEALTGQPPFEGNLFQVLQSKQTTPAPSPRALCPDVPADLDELCQALLQQDPTKRPNAQTVLAALGAMALPQTTPSEAPLWVGRSEETNVINGAFAQARQGHTVVMTVHGSSGVGKSALLRHALEQIAQRHDAVVLAGRCYERELVPYRGLDSVIDALTRHLLASKDTSAVVPRDAEALTRLFPVLRRVPAFARSVRRPLAADPQAQRRQAWHAFRELLGRLSDEKPLLICIDDWQWGDEDSARLMLETLCAADAPALLLVLCHRTEDDNQCLRTFAEGLAEATTVTHVPLPVLPLPEPDATALAKAWLPSQDPRQAISLAREAAGNAFFLRALVNHCKRDVHSTGATLQDMVRARMEALSAPARSLLHIVATAGRPTLLEIAMEAAALNRTQADCVTELRQAHLLRSHDNVVEIDHDRIRAAITGLLPPAQQRDCHTKLLHALLGREDADPEILGSHYLAVGRTKEAAQAFTAASARADAALAFEHSVHLLGQAITLYGPTEQGLCPLYERMGHALVNLGRGEAAANAYLAAAQDSEPNKALDLRRRAAEQLLRTGHLQAGLQVLDVVLGSIGERLASSSRRALLPLLWRRARIRWRGLRYQERSEATISAEQLLRLDVFWSVSTALGIIDNVRAMDFQTRHLRLALKLGEPNRIARALAAEAGYSAVRGTATKQRTAALVEVAAHAAARVKEPFAQGWATLAQGMGKYLEAQHTEAVRLCDSAANTFEGCLGVWWEMGSARLFGAWSRYYLGAWKELAQQLPLQVAEAEARGDLYTATSLSSSVLCFPWLLNDDVVTGARVLQERTQRWPREPYHALSYWQMVAQCHFALYQGQGEQAWQRLHNDAQALRRSLLLRVQTARVEHLDLRGRCLLARAIAQPLQRTKALGELHSVLRSLRKEASPWAQALAAGLRAGVAALAQDAAARSLYLAATEAFSQANMQGHAAVARLRAAALAPVPAERSAEMAAANQWLQQAGVKRPLRFANVLLPTLP